MQTLLIIVSYTYIMLEYLLRHLDIIIKQEDL